MGIPYICRKCGDLVGMEPEGATLARLYTGNFNSEIDALCPGKGNHPKPKRSEKVCFFGLIRQVTTRYPETHTSATWGEYCGPASKFWLWFAIVFGSDGDGLTVNGQWAWWRRDTGFFGKGIDELPNIARS